MCLCNHYHNRMTFSRLNSWRLLRGTGKESSSQNTDARTRIIDVLIFHCYSESLGLFNLAASKICLSQPGPKCPAPQMKSEAEQQLSLNKGRGQGRTITLLCFIPAGLEEVMENIGFYSALGTWWVFFHVHTYAMRLPFIPARTWEISTREDSRRLTKVLIITSPKLKIWHF